MKRILLTVLTVFILAHAPWRLMSVAVDAFVVRPGFTQISSGDERYWDALQVEANIVRLGYRVEYAPNLISDGQRAYGITVYHERMVYIDESLHWNMRLAVLAHEGGHILAPWAMNEGQEEIFAEAVSAVVTGESREHARYMSSRKQEIFTMFAFWTRIYRAAALLVE